MKLTFCKACAPSHCKADKEPCHKARQLIYGPVYLNCDRLKRNGLQYECKRTQCLYNPDCHRGNLRLVCRDTGACCFGSKIRKTV